MTPNAPEPSRPKIRFRISSTEWREEEVMPWAVESAPPTPSSVKFNRAIAMLAECMEIASPEMQQSILFDLFTKLAEKGVDVQGLVPCVLSEVTA